MHFGAVGFTHTVKNLEAKGIKRLGHENQILYLEANQILIDIIGFTTYGLYNSVHNLETARSLVRRSET